MDEIYTFGLSNSHFAPFLSDIKGGSLNNQVLHRQELLDYLTVGEADRFDYKSVIYNQSQDVHPPLFYFLVNAISSVFEDSFSKWIVLVPNIGFYFLTLLFLYRLAVKLFGKREYGIIAVILYGLSRGTLSTMLMLRMYMLLTLLTIILAYNNFAIWEYTARDTRLNLRYTGRLCINCVLIFCGLMTQYFYVFYAMFAGLGLLVLMLRRRKWKHAVSYTVSLLIGGLLFACVYFSFLNNAGNHGVLRKDPFTAHEFWWRVLRFLKQIAGSFPVPILVAAAALIAIPRIRGKGSNTDWFDEKLCLLLLPIIPCILIIVSIVTLPDLRYLYSLMPLLILFPVWTVYRCDLSGRSYRSMAAVWFIAAGMFIVLLLKEPEWVYRENRNKYDGLAKIENHCPCVYYQTSPIREAWAATQDLPELVRFDNVCFTNDLYGDAAETYLKNHDSSECALYITEGSNEGRDATAAEFAERYGYMNMEFLYTSSASNVYVVSEKAQ